MRLQDKIGLDKIAHFGLWGYATFAIAGVPLQPYLHTAGFALVALAAVVKERTDPVFSWRDVAASWLGMSVPLIMYLLKTFICK